MSTRQLKKHYRDNGRFGLRTWASALSLAGHHMKPSADAWLSRKGVDPNGCKPAYMMANSGEMDLVP